MCEALDKIEALNIVLIGPVYPYKGGIAHYTGLLCKALRKRHEVTMISYAFQYPKLLFKKEQRDYDNDTFRIDDTEFLLHTANPLNWGRVAKRINSMRPDMVIIQWWHPYFAPCYQGLVRKLRDTKILFVCHNVFPHERFPMDTRLTTGTLKLGDSFIVQSKRDALDLLSILPHARFEQTVHPTYNAFKMQDMPKETAREILGLHADEKVLLFFGFIRAYKGLKYLIQAMPEIVSRLPHVRLLIVGDFGTQENKKEHEELIAATGVAESINIYDGYIPDKEIEKFFAACELVVCPYTDATQSGIVQIAYGFDKPVIATNVGGLPDVVTDGETGFIVEPENSNAIADAVMRFFTENRERAFAENVRKESARYDWDRMTEVIERLSADTKKRNKSSINH